MNPSESTPSSGAAVAGWLLTLAGGVALTTLAYGVLSTDYRRMRFVSLLQGHSSIGGVGVESWLMFCVPLALIAFGVGLIATGRSTRRHH